jgi:hypothetical protein
MRFLHTHHRRSRTVIENCRGREGRGGGRKEEMISVQPVYRNVILDTRCVFVFMEWGFFCYE